MKLTESIRNAPYRFGAMVTVATFSAMDAAQAQSGGNASTVGEAAKSVLSQVTNVGKLAVGGAFLIGVIMVAGGLMKLKAAAENQGQNPPYSSGLWRLALGAGLVALPALTGMLTQSGGVGGVTISPATGF